MSAETTEARYQGAGVVSFLTLAADCLVREQLTPLCHRRHFCDSCCFQYPLTRLPPLLLKY